MIGADYIWHNPNLMDFKLNPDMVENYVSKIKNVRDQLISQLPPIGIPSAVTDSIISTHTIEGVHYDRDSVYGSLARRLHYSHLSTKKLDKSAETIIDFQLYGLHIPIYGLSE